MCLTQQDFASVIETVQINYLSWATLTFIQIAFFFLQSCLNCLYFSFFLVKSLKLFFVSTKSKKFQQKMDKLEKTTFALKFEMQGKPFKTDSNISSICLSITALLKLTLQCLFTLLVSNKIPK